MISTLKNILRASCLMGSLALFVAPSYAQFTINFDENGNGTTCTGSCVANTFYVGVDPNTGLTTLIYDLPNQIVGGAVGINDSNGSLSDVIDFFDANNNGYMAYYSGDSNGALADGHANLSAVFPNVYIGAVEATDGTFSYNVGNVYNGISAAETPEPGTLAPLAGALLAIGAAIRRKIAK